MSFAIGYRDRSGSAQVKLRNLAIPEGRLCPSVCLESLSWLRWLPVRTEVPGHVRSGCSLPNVCCTRSQNP